MALATSIHRLTEPCIKIEDRNNFTELTRVIHNDPMQRHSMLYSTSLPVVTGLSVAMRPSMLFLKEELPEITGIKSRSLPGAANDTSTRVSWK